MGRFTLPVIAKLAFVFVWSPLWSLQQGNTCEIVHFQHIHSWPLKNLVNLLGASEKCLLVVVMCHQKVAGEGLSEDGHEAYQPASQGPRGLTAHGLSPPALLSPFSTFLHLHFSSFSHLFLSSAPHPILPSQWLLVGFGWPPHSAVCPSLQPVYAD